MHIYANAITIHVFLCGSVRHTYLFICHYMRPSCLSMQFEGVTSLNLIHTRPNMKHGDLY